MAKMKTESIKTGCEIIFGVDLLGRSHDRDELVVEIEGQFEHVTAGYIRGCIAAFGMMEAK